MNPPQCLQVTSARLPGVPHSLHLSIGSANGWFRSRFSGAYIIALSIKTPTANTPANDICIAICGANSPVHQSICLTPGYKIAHPKKNDATIIALIRKCGLLLSFCGLSNASNKVVMMEANSTENNADAASVHPIELLKARPPRAYL